MYELRITLLSAILLFLIGSLEVKAEEVPPVLNDYKPIANVTLCQDVMLPCILMIPKTADLHFAVFDEKGKLIAITQMHEGKEIVIWGKLPLKKNEVEL